MTRLRVAVFASGGGTNLQALLDRFPPQAASRAHIALVVASRTGIGALARADAAEVPSVVVDPRSVSPAEATARLHDELGRREIELVVLAGYMHLVPAEVVESFRGRMINIHPALLPAFGGKGMYGARVHQAVLAAGVTVSGATVHLVDERYDTGPIIAQWPVPVFRDDTPESLAARVLVVEHRLLPAVVEAFSLRAGEQPHAEIMTGFALAAEPAPSEAQLRRLVRLPAPR